MVFTPDNSLIIRSVEYGDGSEYDAPSSDSVTLIPDHYVQRLWRRKLLVGNGSMVRSFYFPSFASFDLWHDDDLLTRMQIQFTNKDANNSRTVLYAAKESEKDNIMTIKEEDATDVARIEWNLKAPEKSR